MSLQARFGKILHVTTKPVEGETRTGDGPRPARKIQTIAEFSSLYEMGKEVMPSTHSYMKVNFATRKADKHEVVVKIRFKPNCFRSREDERSWRYNTEFLLNMPDNAGVAKLYEVLEDSKAFYVVMEKVDGMDLFETLEVEGRVPVDMAKDILRQLLESLAFLHAQGAVHKDLKLENVMVDKGVPGRSASPTSVKVIDFDTLEEWTPASPTSKDVVGTDQYIAQEAYAGKYSPLSDIFSTGVIAYRLLTGKFPFQDDLFDDEAGENWVGSPKMAQIRRKLKVAKVDFSHSQFAEHGDACDLVMRMLAYQENQRPTAAAALEHPWFQDSNVSGKIPVTQELLDDGIIVAEEEGVGDQQKQALLRS
eukprot:CAMPEP_0115066866 /NCGR_PEP_ID=MMETSP0227-20121206/11057_1 /TAXON_ID=89957 /ORGANISM="Polarella glacialis, Strain CCMP 1383" /LENGTH=363 /DNA_ID=CAMNT_0002452839 /DNA_START=54 /DNA_END=1145 /DNA_ORIENTATION=-